MYQLQFYKKSQEMDLCLHVGTKKLILHVDVCFLLPIQLHLV